MKSLKVAHTRIFSSSQPQIRDLVNSSPKLNSTFIGRSKSNFSIFHSFTLDVPFSFSRAFSTNLNKYNNLINPPQARETMEYDVLIVGGGPAGLSAAIRLKQLEKSKGREISVCVVEKAAEIGAHILSGNVFEPRSLDELFPEWRKKDSGLEPLGSDPTEVTEDDFVVLVNDKSSVKVPNILLPKGLHNHGNYVISLGKLVRWLGAKAEEMGVEIYPGFPAAEVIYNEDQSAVVGVVTKDMGLNKNGEPKEGLFAPGMMLRAKQTIFAEGARGSCAEQVIAKFNLRKDCEMQSYGLGLKEVWQVDESKLNETFKAGRVQHTLGWPMDLNTYAGSFLYHMKPNYILLGYVVGLDYQNPYLNPYKEFQRLKHHPEMLKHLKNATCVSYGARVINEGGFQAIPKLTFNGGMLIGCSAGFLNVPKIKGSHTAMKSGIVAAEAVYDNLDSEKEIKSYQEMMEKSWVWDELKSVRNYAPSFKYGVLPGVLYSGVSGLVLKGREPFTLSKHRTGQHRDCEATSEKTKAKEIDYPKPDGKISFDILENLSRSGTNHDHDQPSHLVIKEDKKKIPESVSLQKFAGPEQRFCPARVYEYVDDKLVINAQNCVHCKCCSIKMPDEYIQWNVPEGGGGPAYEIM